MHFICPPDGFKTKGLVIQRETMKEKVLLTHIHISMHKPPSKPKDQILERPNLKVKLKNIYTFFTQSIINTIFFVVYPCFKGTVYIHRVHYVYLQMLSFFIL